MKQKIVVIYSGGMDSFTLLNDLVMKSKYDISVITFDYGQRHKKEIEYAEHVCNLLSIDQIIIDMSKIGHQIMAGSSQTSATIEVPKGHYADENMKLTVVPNRNMIMISMAVAYAVQIGATAVYLGVHSGDHAIYPDCRPSFIRLINEVTMISNYLPVQVMAPYIHMDKGDIAKIGRDLNLNYGLAWTCYQGGKYACGECGACVERQEAMEAAGLTDPMIYADDLVIGADEE